MIRETELLEDAETIVAPSAMTEGVSMTIRVIIADDHAMMRGGLRSILEDENDLEVIGEAADGREALSLSREMAPHVVVMDIAMPNLNGIEATRQLRREVPEAKVVALSMHSDKRYVMRMLEAGACAYVMKNAACDELVHAIRVAHSGKSYLSPEITEIVVDNSVRRQSDDVVPMEKTLGAREREVLQLLAEGHTSATIAKNLHISPRTVEAHRRNIMKKLDLHSVAELTKYAIREGLTSL